VCDVSISYAYEDLAFVERLRAALVGAGRDVWVDVAGIEPADRWRSSAHEAIERFDAVVFVISAESLRSAACLGELQHAVDRNKRLVPVCVDQTAVDMDLPAALAELSWVMMRHEDDFDAGVRAIGRAWTSTSRSSVRSRGSSCGLRRGSWPAAVPARCCVGMSCAPPSNG
jgi:hypothetical protein